MASSEKLFSLWNNYRKLAGIYISTRFDWHSCFDIYITGVSIITWSLWQQFGRQGFFSAKTFRSFQLRKSQMFLAKYRFLQQAKLRKGLGSNSTLLYPVFLFTYWMWVMDWWNHKKPCRTEISGFSTTPQWVSSSSSNFNTGFASLACWRFSHEPTSDLLHHL